jgi:hypothetical protein
MLDKFAHLFHGIIGNIWRIKWENNTMQKKKDNVPKDDLNVLSSLKQKI